MDDDATDGWEKPCIKLLFFDLLCVTFVFSTSEIDGWSFRYRH